MNDNEDNYDGNEDGTTGLEPGKVYFMREFDLRTGQEFPYYKIGKVLNDKDVEKRVKEHQTGNPRSIRTVAEIESKLVTRLETTLHNVNALNRIHSGEWFFFETSQDLQTAIDQAQKLNEDLEQISEFEANAAVLKCTVSNGSLKAGTSEEDDIANLLKSYTEAQKTVSELSIAVSNQIQTCEQDELFALIARKQVTVSKPRFSATTLKSKYPDLHKAFSTSPSFSSIFRLNAKVTGGNGVLTEEDLGLGADEAALAGLSLQEAHAEYLRLWALKANLAWTILGLTATLKASTEDYDGIEGVANWKRFENFKFNSASFKLEHPEIYLECQSAERESKSFKVFEWKSY